MWLLARWGDGGWLVEADKRIIIFPMPFSLQSYHHQEPAVLTESKGLSLHSLAVLITHHHHHPVAVCSSQLRATSSLWRWMICGCWDMVGYINKTFILYPRRHLPTPGVSENNVHFRDIGGCEHVHRRHRGVCRPCL